MSRSQPMKTDELDARNAACPSSRERRVARSTALMSVRRTPPSSSAAMPAMVVPPGDATMSLSWPGCMPVSRMSRAEPEHGLRGQGHGGGAVEPHLHAAVGERLDHDGDVGGPGARQPGDRVHGDPRRARPRGPPRRTAPGRSRDRRARGPRRARWPSTPSSTRAGVLGITRIRRAGLASCSRSVAVATPAATEMRSFRSSTAGAISLQHGAMICGFTARMITSDSATRAGLCRDGADAVLLAPSAPGDRRARRWRRSTPRAPVRPGSGP